MTQEELIEISNSMYSMVNEADRNISPVPYAMSRPGDMLPKSALLYMEKKIKKHMTSVEEAIHLWSRNSITATARKVLRNLEIMLCRVEGMEYCIESEAEWNRKKKIPLLQQRIPRTRSLKYTAWSRFYSDHESAGEFNPLKEQHGAETNDRRHADYLLDRCEFINDSIEENLQRMKPLYLEMERFYKKLDPELHRERRKELIHHVVEFQETLCRNDILQY